MEEKEGFLAKLKTDNPELYKDIKQFLFEDEKVDVKDMEEKIFKFVQIEVFPPEDQKVSNSKIFSVDDKEESDNVAF